MPPPEPEIEWTYDVAPDAAAAVLTALEEVSRRELCVASTVLRCVKADARLRTFLYLQTESPEQTERLIFQQKQGAIVGRLSSKRWDSAPEGLKYHCGTVSDSRLATWVEFLHEGPPVYAALVKAQRRYRFRGKRGPRFTTAFDAMVPFAPGSPSAAGDPFFHLEVEATESGDPSDFASAVWPLYEAFRHMTPATTSKKERAAGFALTASKPHVLSDRDLERYVVTVHDTLTAKLGSLLPLLLAGPDR